jgi:hypothetical protein
VDRLGLEGEHVGRQRLEGRRLDDGEWTTAEHDDFLTAFWGATPAGKQVKGERYTAPGKSGE